jgi:hypothetical protein
MLYLKRTNLQIIYLKKKKKKSADYIEKKASLGLDRLFLLPMRTADWYLQPPTA